MAEQPDPLRQFMIAAHFNLESVKAGLREHPEWLNIVYDWGEGGGLETPLGAAAHVGTRSVAEYLLGRGAPLTPHAAAMLGMKSAVEAFIDADPAAVNAPGAHGIPLMTHAAISGDVEIAEVLKARGSKLEGVTSGLHMAAGAGHTAMVEWLLAHGADVMAGNYQGKTALELAEANGHADIVTVIRTHTHI